MMLSRLEIIKNRLYNEKQGFHKEELVEIADVEYLVGIVPKELKHKKDVPTVIEYQGRRYILDHVRQRRK